MLLLDWSLSVFNMFCAFNVCQWKRNAIHKMKAKKWMGLQIWLDLTMSEREKQYPSSNCGQKHKRNWYVCNMGLSISETEFTQMPSSTRIICNMQWFFWQKKKEKLFLNICSSFICVWDRKCIWESERGKTSFPEMISLQEKGKLNETHCRYHSPNMMADHSLFTFIIIMVGVINIVINVIIMIMIMMISSVMSSWQVEQLTADHSITIWQKVMMGRTLR